MASPLQANGATEAERLAGLELSRLFKLTMRLRILGAPTIAFIGLLFLLYDEAWRGWLCIGAASPVFLLAIWETSTLRKQRLPPERIAGIMGSVLIVALALAVATGGITSPVMIPLPLIVVMVAFGAGRRWVVFAVLGVLLIAVWSLATVAFTSPALEPIFFARGRAPAALVTFFLLVLTVAPCFGMVAAMALRGALERAVTSAAQSRSELVKSMRDRNEELLALAGALAHELKNPLAAIRGLAALQAKRLEDGTKQAEQMGVLLDEVGRMGTILDEFLNFSRPASGLATEDVDAARVVEDIRRIHEPLAGERGVTLAADAVDPAPIVCDPRKLKQILVNLMQNAIDASEQGSEVVTRISVHGDEHIFRVEDRGVGLSDALRGRLFIAGATTKAAGSGLGLTIARAIAEQHGGSLTISERAGGGCVAELRLPSKAATREDGNG